MMVTMPVRVATYRKLVALLGAIFVGSQLVISLAFGAPLSQWIGDLLFAPFRADIERAPPFALAFSELAWRAGEFAVAREVLASLMPPQAAEETTRSWSLKMDWIDAPRAEKTEPIPL